MSTRVLGLQRAPELSKKNSRGKADENLIEASGVGYHAGKGRCGKLFDYSPIHHVLPQNACKLRLSGIEDEHLDREIRKTPLNSAR